jgi:hypothetical protein
MGGKKGETGSASAPKPTEKWHPVHCERCDRIGWLSYTVMVAGQPIRRVARCSCANGARLAASVPLYDQIAGSSAGSTQAELDMSRAFMDPDAHEVQRRGIAWLRSILRPGSEVSSQMEAWVSRSGLFGSPRPVHVQVPEPLTDGEMPF